MKKILMIFAILGLSAVAQAQIVFSPGVTYQSYDQTESQVGNTDSQVDGYILDLRFGYLMPMGLYLGGMYSMASGLGAVGGNGDDTKGFSVGPTVGYYSMMGFYSLLTYHIMGETEKTIYSQTSTFTGAKGPQVDIGWVFPLSSFFSIGPQITWKSIEFSKIEGGGSEADTNYKQTSIQPYISLWFMF
ncbi:MAG: hypothetical protein KDD33_07450 [Bdellovibrionales bacterium]|nr:hypothetical protein [Bdellovibrionales bacterium]